MPGSFISLNALVTLLISNALVTSKAFATSAKPFLVVSVLAMVPSYTRCGSAAYCAAQDPIYADSRPDSRENVAVHNIPDMARAARSWASGSDCASNRKSPRGQDKAAVSTAWRRSGPARPKRPTPRFYAQCVHIVRFFLD